MRCLFRGSLKKLRGMSRGLVPFRLVGVGASHLLLWLATLLR